MNYHLSSIMFIPFKPSSALSKIWYLCWRENYNIRLHVQFLMWETYNLAKDNLKNVICIYTW
jgi:hypothetical protein